MLASTEQFLAYLNANKLKYDYTEPEDDDKKDVVVVRFTGHNLSTITVQFFFSTDGEDAAIRVFDLFKVPEDRHDKIYKALNEQNNALRFVKFCFDENDNTVQMEMDAAFRENDVGDICGELLFRSVELCDKAYPAFMQALWA